jgi:hypothetical protein
MSLEEVIDRLKYRLQGYFYSEKKSVKYLARLLSFTLFAAVVSTIAPTLADELSTDPAMLQPVTSTAGESSTLTVSDTSTSSPSPNATFSPEPQISRPPVANSSASALPESSESATANGPGIPLEVQPKYTLRIPSSAAIDPRATTYFATHIFASQPDPDVDFTMVCISGAGLNFDVKVKKSTDNSPEGDELITGDLSGNLIISASTNRVVNLINSYNGLFISSTGGGLAGRSLTYRFIAVTKPVADPEFCGAARSGAITTFRALGLDLSTVKGGGKLK